MDVDLTGVFPVIEVPFGEQLDLDVPGIREVVKQQAVAGAHGVMFPGYASEYLKLSAQERQDLTREVVHEATRHDLVPVVSIHDHSIVTAVRSFDIAVEVGARAVNVLLPHQLSPSRDDVHRHLVAVLDHAGDVPVIVQYAPAQAGFALSVADLRQLAARHDNLAMVKVDGSPAGRIISLLADRNTPGRPVPATVGYAGLHLMDALRRGAVGVQPGCSFTELYVSLWSSWAHGDGDAADRLHREMLPYLSTWMQSVELMIAVDKELSVRRGWIGSAQLRPPGYLLDSVELKLVEEFGRRFFNLTSRP